MLAYFLHYFKLFQLATPMVNGPDFVIPNLTLNLTCTANGIDSTSNATTFIWSKDGVTLSQYTGPQLTKTALTSDSGLYACSVTYLGVTSNVSQPLNLTVQVKNWSQLTNYILEATFYITFVF
jgi:hypothetical protein